MNRASSPVSSTAAGPQFHNPTMRRSPNGHSTSSSMRPQGMTVAQKLYASSGAAAAPMINTNSITSLSTSVDAASTPSPPSSSNRVSMLPTPTSTSPLRSESSRPMSYLPQSRVSQQGSRINPHNNNRPGAALYASAREPSVPSNNSGDHNPHRAATEPLFQMPTTSTNTVHERPHSQNAGSLAPNSYSSFLRPRPTPNLVTKARPPPLDVGVQPGRVDFATSPLPLSVQATSPPSASLLFSNPADNLSLSRPSSGTSPHNAHLYNNFGLDQQSRVDAALDATAGGLDPARLLSMLKTALSVNPIAESELRAVAYTQPNANYQSVMNALKHQQRYRITSTLPSGVGVQHHSPLGSVDYQLLITEVERLEVKATLAQQSQQAAIIVQQQQMALDALRKQQEATLAQQQQSILNQQVQEQAVLNSNLQPHQNIILAQQQALLHQQAQEEAKLKLQIQQQQQTAFSQQQVAINQQAQEQAMLNLQIQQQNHAAIAHQQAILNQKKAEEQAALKLQLQQQALMQANQQQFYTLQQHTAPVNHSQPHQPTTHQWGQQQQQQQSGLGTFMGSVIGGGSQQQAGGQGNSSIQQRVVSHLFDSVVNSLQGPGASDPSACGDAGNQGLMSSITQTFNGFSGGSQDPSSGLSGLFGGAGNVDFTTMVAGNTDLSTLTASVDFSSGVDFSSDD